MAFTEIFKSLNPFSLIFSTLVRFIYDFFLSATFFFSDFSDFLDFLWKTFFGAACIDPSNLTLVPRETVPLFEK